MLLKPRHISSALLITLAACHPIEPAPVAVCPAMHERWTPEQQKALARDIEVIGDPILKEAFRDYWGLREQAAACAETR